MTSSFDLPPELKSAIAEKLGRRGRGGLRTGTGALTRIYRAGGRSAETMDLSAYLAARLPATYAAVSRALRELSDLMPAFEPASCLDAGSGPGTASWAAAGRWPAIASFCFLDDNPAFLALAGELSRHSASPALATARSIRGDIASPGASADLVVAAYALAELPENRAGEVARTLWRTSAQVLVIVEPGTPQGFARVRSAREALIGEGASIAAPCTHGDTCPMAGQDWCHFSVRLPRSRLHMQAKAANVPFEDERFSYVIATRMDASLPAARIIAPPDAAKASIRFRLCAADGVSEPVIARRDAPAYKLRRKLAWGDGWT